MYAPAAERPTVIRLRALYERVGVREYWLVHPVGKVVTVYLLENGAYGKPGVQELAGTSTATILPGITIDRARVMRED